MQTTTNIIIRASDLGLTLDRVIAGQALVTGTIDDDRYTVYVNGVQATNDGYGKWSATITPIGISGGAVVVNAIQSGGDPTLQQIVDPPLGMSFPEEPWWMAFAGGLEGELSPNLQGVLGSAVKFTAPSNAATAIVRVIVRDVQLDKTFTVLEPSGYDHAEIYSTHTGDFRPGKIAAMMSLNLWMAPTAVSFYRVDFSEVGSNGVAGRYFANTNYFSTWHHYPNGTNDDCKWTALDELNRFRDDAGFVPKIDNWPTPLASGSLSFDIPVIWKIRGDNQTNSMKGWNQSIYMDENGKIMVTKFGKLVTRDISNVVNPIVNP